MMLISQHLRIEYFSLDGKKENLYFLYLQLWSGANWWSEWLKDAPPPLPPTPFPIRRVIDILRTVINDNIEGEIGNEALFPKFSFKISPL